jgi:hypothetical protein
MDLHILVRKIYCILVYYTLNLVLEFKPSRSITREFICGLCGEQNKTNRKEIFLLQILSFHGG